MKTISRIAVTAFALTLAVTVSANEKRVKLKDLPEAVRKTVLEQSKGGKILALSSEEENGKTTYEAELQIGASRKDVAIDAAGAVIETEEKIKFAALPAAVKAGLLKAAGKGKITAVEAISNNGAVTMYEAEVHAHGKKSDVKVGPDGALVVEPASAKEAKERGEHGDKD